MKSGKKFSLLLSFLIFISLIAINKVQGWTNDVTPPAISIGVNCNGTPLSNGGICNAQSATITINYSDSGTGESGLQSINHTITNDTSSSTACTPTLSINSNNPTYSCSYEYPAPNTTSSYVVNASATDWAENQSNNGSPITFSFNFAYTVSGYVYEDKNGDGVYDSGDTPFSTGTGLGHIHLYNSATGKELTASSPVNSDSTGYYAFANVPSGSYNVTVDTPTGYKTVAYIGAPPSYGGSPTQPLNVNANTANIDFFVEGFKVTGTVYYDSDHDGVSGTTDTAYSGIFTITANGSSCAVSSNTYTCGDLAPGTYSTTINLTGQTNPSYVVNAPCAVSALAKTCTQSIVISSSDSVQDFYVTKIYSISGTVFDDVNKNGVKDSADTIYSGGTTITVPSGPLAVPNTTSDSSGNYTFADLVSGTYTVQIVVPTSPVQWIKTYPSQGTNYYTASVGDGAPACSLTPNSPDPNYSPPNMCSAQGSLLGVDFGISDSIVWQQCVGADCHLDSQEEIVPSGASQTCSAGAYAIGANNNSISPGVYFGETPTPSSAISSTGWIAISPPYNFSPVNPGIIRTSYEYIQTTLSQADITPTNLSSYCGSGGISDCSLPSDPSKFPNGVYIANGNLYLNTTVFPYDATNNIGKNYVILVNGDLYINGKVLVPNGSTATFYASNNIYVESGVGEPTPTKCIPSTTPGGTSTGCDIEGFYSADKNFTTQGKNDCTQGPDYQLNIDGAVVVNAADAPGEPTGIDNQRDLCGYDNTCPTYAITERPDMILNAPQLIKHPNYVWQEVAPVVITPTPTQ